jgi:hypothetical protein
VEEVRQLGVDRVVDLVFGVGDNAHHLILEMYAQVGQGGERTGNGGWVGGLGGGMGDWVEMYAQV